MDFRDLVQVRRSHRKFTEEAVSPQDIRLLLRSALMSPTSKSTRAWQFRVTTDAATLAALSTAKDFGGQMLAGAPLGIVVSCSETASPCWIEDASIAALTMQYQAADLGLGSCWVQMRDHARADGTPSDEVIHRLFPDMPRDQRVLCVLAVGHYADERKPQNEDALKWDSVSGLDR